MSIQFKGSSPWGEFTWGACCIFITGLCQWYSKVQGLFKHDKRPYKRHVNPLIYSAKDLLDVRFLGISSFFSTCFGFRLTVAFWLSSFMWYNLFPTGFGVYFSEGSEYRQSIPCSRCQGEAAVYWHNCPGYSGQNRKLIVELFFYILMHPIVSLESNASQITWFLDCM